MNARAQAGFTLVETLIAMTLVVLAACGALAACRVVATALAQSSSALQGGPALDSLAQALRVDASDAMTISAQLTGNVIDFSAKVADGSTLSWRYVYDARAQTVQRWDIGPDGSLGVRDAATGQLNSGATYPPVLHVTQFAATMLPVDELENPQRNPYAAIGSLFVHAPRPYAVRYGSAPTGGVAPTGGNNLVAVTLKSGSATRTIHLGAGALPSGFTVTGAPVWHAVLYRVDQTHRSWLGVVGKSHVFINARVDVSYDDWSTREGWCDFTLLGDPGGLDANDPHANYQPTQPVEQSANLLAQCRQRTPQPPGPDGSPPAPAPTPLPTDTPPACWSMGRGQGRCWPAVAPSNWSPPGLDPGETPPPPWCAQHAPSNACGSSVSPPR